MNAALTDWFDHADKSFECSRGFHDICPVWVFCAQCKIERNSDSEHCECHCHFTGDQYE